MLNAAKLDQIADAAARLTQRPLEDLDYAELGVTCWQTDPAVAKVIREWILEFGPLGTQPSAAAVGDSAITQSGEIIVNAEVQRLEARLAAAKQRAQIKYKPGELVPVIVMDAANRPITHYEGDPNACWDQFNPPIRHVRRFMTPGTPLAS